MHARCQAAWDRVDRFFATFNAIFSTPPFHRRFHGNVELARHYVMTLLPVVAAAYNGNTYDRDVLEVITTCASRTFRKNMLSRSRRQFGKSATIAAAIAALILNVDGGPHLEGDPLVQIMSITERASKGIIETIAGILEAGNNLGPAQGTRIVRNAMSISVLSPYNGLWVRVEALNGQMDRIRGAHARVQIFDEGDYLQKNVLPKHASISVGVSGRVVIITSTPGAPQANDNAAYSAEIFAKKPGAFTVLSLALACEECQTKNEPHRCPHRTRYTPEWNSFGDIFDLVEEYGMTSAILSEHLGVPSENESALLSPVLVNKLFCLMPDRHPGMATHLLFGFDPPAGGKSAGGATSILWHAGLRQATLVAVDSITFPPAAEAPRVSEMAVRHLMAVEEAYPEVFAYGPVCLVHAVECNLANIISNAIVMVVQEFAAKRGMPCIGPPRHKPTDPYGFQTRADTKETAARKFHELIACDLLALGAPVTSTGLVEYSPRAGDFVRRVKGTPKDELHIQAQAFRREARRDEKGVKDDAIMSTMLALQAFAFIR
jgi:hypothetical protein